MPTHHVLKAVCAHVTVNAVCAHNKQTLTIDDGLIILFVMRQGNEKPGYASQYGD